MKTVFSLSEVAHIWANEIQENARNADSTLFIGGKGIYSYGYHFCIAKHLEPGVILFTKRTYSNTTAKHINKAMQASSHKIKVYCNNPDATNEDNFKSWLVDAEQIVKKLMVAKKPEIYLNQLAQIKQEVEIFCKYLNITSPVNLDAILNVSNRDEYLAFNEDRAKLEKKEAALKLKKLKERHKIELKEFYNFERNFIYNRIDFDYLRINGEMVQTTQQVNIKIDEAKKFYEAIKANKVIPGMHILSYQVLEVTKKTIKIGCHNFELKHILEIGAKL